MKTPLTLISAVLTLAVPTAFAAQVAGIRVPAYIDTSHVLTGFVVAFTLLTAFFDYSRPQKVRMSTVNSPARIPRGSAKAAHPLAA